MANLKELSTNINGEAGRQALLSLLETSALLRMFESTGGWELDATDFQYWTIGGNANLRTLAEGGTYDTISTLAIDGKQNNSLKFYYDGFKVNQSRKFDAAKSLRDIDLWLQKKRKAIHRAFAKGVEKAIFVDDGTSNTMKGFAKNLDGTRLLGYESTDNFTDQEAKRVLDAAAFAKSSTAKKMDLTSDTDYDGFMELFYTAVSLMDNAKMMVIPDFAKPKITTIARKAGLLGTTKNYEKVLETIGDIPLITVPNNVITRLEADNTATPVNDTTSFYFLSPEEQRCSLVTNSGLWYNEYDHRENEQKDLEMFGINMQLKIEDNKSVLRVRNLKI